MWTFLHHCHIFSSRLAARKHARSTRGFTLIELMVTIAIMAMVTGVVLLDQRKFDSATLLRSHAYEIALATRLAQVYGVSVRESAQGGSFDYSYGIFFAKSSPSNYSLFIDLNGNRTFDAAGSELVQQYTLPTGYTISEVCATLSSGTSQRCTGTDDSTGLATINNVSVIYVRPNTDAIFKTDSGITETYRDARVVVTGPSGNTRMVQISNTGQILVCPLNTAITSC